MSRPGEVGIGEAAMDVFGVDSQGTEQHGSHGEACLGEA